MRTEIVLKNVDNEAEVREFIQRKIESAFERIDGRINLLVVKLQDEKGKSEAFGGLCQIDAALNPIGQIHVSANGKSAYDSITQAIEKIDSAIKHDIDRHRRSSRIRHEKSKRTFITSLAPDESVPSQQRDELSPD